MNSVHEQCPNIDSETVLNPKTEQVHSVHSKHAKVPQARPGARAHGRVVGAAAVSWPSATRSSAVSRHSVLALAPLPVTIHHGVLQYSFLLLKPPQL